MRKIIGFKRMCSMATLLVLSVAWLPGQSPTRTLEVKIAYTGAGEVDAANGIHLFLFDTPNIAEGSMPIGMSSVFKNNDVAVFPDLTTSPVYLVTAYGQAVLLGPPSPGTPVSRYKPDDPTGPTPIELNQGTTEIEFSFDDSIRMP